MSITSLANEEVKKELTSLNINSGQKPGAPPPPDPTNKASNLLTKFIPTESITLYVAAVAAAPAFQKIWPKRVDQWSYETIFYVLFLILTPLLVLLIYANQRKFANMRNPLPKKIKQWPWWLMISSTIAFLAWALAIPKGPFLQGANLDAKGVVAGFLAVFISVILEQVNKALPPSSRAG